MDLPRSGLDEALVGVKVLDVSRVLAGPFCGQHLADLGADVVKIEEPQRGDETRTWGPPFVDDLSAYFMSCNRGKRSVALDLKDSGDHALFEALVARADVLLENFMPDAAERLGLTRRRLHALNPRLIIISFSGFGRDGPDAQRPGYDFVVQGMSGMMAMTGPEDGLPYKSGVAIADLFTGLYAASGVLAALYARARSGHGYHVELALFDCAVASMANVAQAYLSSGKSPQRQANAHLQIVPYQMFQTADDWLILAVGNDGQWRKFCEVAGRAGLADDVRYASNVARVRARKELVPLVAEIMRERTAAAWEEALCAAGVPCGPVWDLDRMFTSDLARARGLRLTVCDPNGKPVDLVRSPLVRTPKVPPLVPPRLGEHTRAVFADWLAMDEGALDALEKSRAP